MQEASRRRRRTNDKMISDTREKRKKWKERNKTQEE